MAIGEEKSKDIIYYPSEEFKENAHISSLDQYKKLYKKSIDDPETFWSDVASEFYFKRGPTGTFLKYNFDVTKGAIEVKWMEGAITNICYNVVDRMIEKGFGDKIAYIWEGSEPDNSRNITYIELRRQVCKFGNVLKSKGIKKGDRVAIYMPVTIELATAMLACARIGAVHTVIFAGFSDDSIAERILDCNCKILVTCDGVYRGTKYIPLKEMADQAVTKCKYRNHHLNAVIVYHHLKFTPNNQSITLLNCAAQSNIKPSNIQAKSLQANSIQVNVIANNNNNNVIPSNTNIQNNSIVTNGSQVNCINSNSNMQVNGQGNVQKKNVQIINNVQVKPMQTNNIQLNGAQANSIQMKIINTSAVMAPNAATVTTNDHNCVLLQQQQKQHQSSSDNANITNNDNTNTCNNNINNNINHTANGPSKTQINGHHNGLSNNNNTSSKNTLIPWNPDIDIWWHEIMDNADDQCEPLWVDAEDPLFILYTSGSTGKPKGIVHTTGGYMIYAATTFKYIFNYNGGDVFFCTADLGWITGHTVSVYGSLANAATIVLFDGTPFYPDPGRLWQIVDTHSVNTLYTAPTAIRSLMRYGDRYVKSYSRASLKLLGTAGESINEEAWRWYYKVVGKGRCPIVDTFWQTETGAPMISSLPGCIPTKPGSATLPFFGVLPAIVNDEGRELTGPCEGHLVFKRPWPSIMRTVDGNHKRYESTYFSRFPGYYWCGDGVRRDKDGYYWITGRTDDLLNVSGHLLSTAEVESSIVDHIAIAEAASVSCAHPVKGECIYCFIVLKDGYTFDEQIEAEIRQQVRTRIGAIATPDVLHLATGLPKTRSGKIVRRILRKIARGERDIGDTSTLSDESLPIVEELFRNRVVFV